MSDPVDFFCNKETEDFFLSDDSDEAFNFKYVSKSQFKSIIKDVKRQRTKEKEDKKWAFLSHEMDSDRSDYEEDNLDYARVSNVKKLMRENMEEVDQELKRLKEDSLPERKKNMYSGSVNERIKNEKESRVESPKGTARKKDASVSTNMLLTIPEEFTAVSTCERSPVSKLECNTKKSLSERTLRPKSGSHSTHFNHATNDSEYNYISGLSDDYEDSDKEEIYNVRPHPVAAHKILSIQKKISDLLEEMAFRLNRIPRPDGERDLLRRQQRVMEFAIRFSRNYLYDLGRQIADINRHVSAIMPSARVKPTRRGISLHMQAIEQKLTAAHQLLLHALSAYCKHIPSSVLKGQPGKLKEILQVVVDLKDICAKIHLTTDYFGCGDVEPPPLGNDIQKRCNSMLLELRVCSDNESQQIVNHTTQSSPVGGLSNKKRINKNHNCRNLPARLSMYSVDSRLSKNSGSRKFVPPRSRERRPSNVTSRIPPNQRPPTPEQPNSNPAACKLSREIGKRRKAKIFLPQREDEISTMMSTLATDSDATSSISGSNSTKYSVKKPFYKNPQNLSLPINAVINDDQCTKTENLVTDQQLSSLVPIIADLMTLVSNKNDVAIRPVTTDSMEALMELLQKYRSSNSDVALDEKSTNRNETRRGDKNMQLICLNLDENAQETHKSIHEKTDRAQNDFTIFGSATKSREISTLTVSETSREALLKYRDDYQYASRLNPMYTSNSQNKPWEVVAWIADKLVDELIVDVSEEFEIKDTIHQLFVLEFKEF